MYAIVIAFAIIFTLRLQCIYITFTLHLHYIYITFTFTLHLHLFWEIFSRKKWQEVNFH
jgi:hypothetical protein